MACRNLVSTNMGVRFRIPLQKLHPLSRAIHHRYSGNTNPQRAPHRTAARYFTSMSRLPMRTPKPPPGSGGRSYQQQRNFWVARLAARLLKLRYILLGSAVGGGYTAKKASTEGLQLRIFKLFSTLSGSWTSLVLSYLIIIELDSCKPTLGDKQKTYRTLQKLALKSYPLPFVAATACYWKKKAKIFRSYEDNMACHFISRLMTNGRTCCLILVNTTGSFLILSGN